MTKLILSHLPHTWILDIDGTLVRHNGHLTSRDVILPGVAEFWKTIPDGDFVILLSARQEKFRSETIQFFRDNNLHFDALIMGLPTGERVLINDDKPGGLRTALAVCVPRDVGLQQFSYELSDKI